MKRRQALPLRTSLVDKPVGIYAGAGASHSWTWLVDCLEAQGVPRLRLISHEDPAAGGLDGLSAILIGGGDPQAMAAAMGPDGARALRRFVEDGGLYVGFCAGAYLPIPLDLPVMDPFVMSGIRLANVVDELPQARALPTKLATPYEDRFVLHAAREGLLVRCVPSDLEWPETLEAPLYGGAPMIVGPEEEPLAYFADFTARTLFLVDEGLAAEILLDRVAVCRRRVGRGELYLFAPHLENPHYRTGHPLLVRLLEDKAPRAGHHQDLLVTRARSAVAQVALAGAAEIDRVRRHVSEARIIAFALEFEDLNWRLGEKYYEPAKIVVLLDTLWRRLGRGGVSLSVGHAKELGNDLDEVVCLLKSIRRGVGEGLDTQLAAERLFPVLGRAVRRFVDAYLDDRGCRMVGASAA
ncbi:MAG: BPL-N domain-containing protein [Thermoleophilia bacterium]